MTEALTALTVPGQWYDTSVDVPDFHKIVGLVAGPREVLLPDCADEYIYGGGYHGGYSKQDIVERPIILGPVAEARLESFFDEYLLEKGWRDQGITRGTYNCHSFAQFVGGAIGKIATARRANEWAEALVRRGEPNRLPLRHEQIGVIGGLGVAGSESFVEAQHSFIALGEGDALQVTGLHGAVAIARQEDTLKYYRETARFGRRIERADLMVYTEAD